MNEASIVQNTRRIIEERGLKQCAVAEKAGFTRKQFSALMNHRRTIKDTAVIAIATALEVTPHALFGISTYEAG